MIGVFGGTFDPVHFGHLRPALEVLQHLQLDGLRLIPACVPPHRRLPQASADQRLHMLELAVDGEAGLKVDRRELDRTGPSYTVDTLRGLRQELGETRPLCLIMGMDAFAGLRSWHEWETIPRLAHLVVTHRPGAVVPGDLWESAWLESARTTAVEDLRRVPAGRVLFTPVTQLDISATAVRELIARGESPRYLLPSRVWDYIRAEGLYAGGAAPEAQAR
ncbi:MAG: nicotinate-nucleotide adenylyltransferase [Gammaproteobacteria bacterium]|jgi:nicotinate-nucleotide adenylyltransferase